MSKNQNLQLRLNIINGWKKKFKGKNIKSIAKRAGVSRAIIYYAMNGSRLPSQSTIDKIEKALNEVNINS